MTPQSDAPVRKIIQLVPASKKTFAIFNRKHKEPSEVIDEAEEEEEEDDDAAFGYDDGELYIPVELWALVEDENGSRSILGMTADDIPAGHFCTDAVNFLRYVTLQDNR